MSSLAWTIAWVPRRPATSGHTYQRYSPATSLWMRPSMRQLAGRTRAVDVVSAENTNEDPLKSSTRYSEASGAGAQARRRARGSAEGVSPDCPALEGNSVFDCAGSVALVPPPGGTPASTVDEGVAVGSLVPRDPGAWNQRLNPSAATRATAGIATAMATTPKRGRSRGYDAASGEAPRLVSVSRRSAWDP